jgi:3-isopropylmalate dehydrogenase
MRLIQKTSGQTQKQSSRMSSAKSKQTLRTATGLESSSGNGSLRNLQTNGDSSDPFSRRRLLDHVTDRSRPPAPIQFDATPVIGVLPGTGIGPQVIDSALKVLHAVGQTLDLKFAVRHGGPIGEEAEAKYGRGLIDPVVRFCSEVFNDGGAVLSGPGGGRYVYDLRRRFDLFCKFIPVTPWPPLAFAGKLAARHLRGVDLLIVRDNAGGVYQGEWRDHTTPAGRVAEHCFHYTEAQVHRITEVAARSAAARRGRLHLIVKAGGVPGITEMWCAIGLANGRKYNVETTPMNVDLAGYELIQNPARFDVMVAPNLFGDILADLTGVLLASRGVTFSGNFDAAGNGVYQTNHGCAHDLAGLDVANPGGQILSLAMLLRESFGFEEAASLIERSLASAWAKGWRTTDIAEPGCRVVGTKAMTDRVVEQIFRFAEAKQFA